MSIRTYNSIGHIAEDEWNSIVGKNRLICTYKYLEAIEKSGINDCRFYYPVVCEGGRIVAHASVYFISTELDMFARGAAKRAIDLVRRVKKDFFIFRSYECGTPVALGSTISFAAGSDREKAFGILRAEIERLAKDNGVATVVFRDFYDDELAQYDGLIGAGYTKIRNLPCARIDVKWKTFDEYLEALRSQYRWKVKDRMRKFHRNGIELSVITDFSDRAENLERLWMNVYEKASEYKRERLTSAFFRNIDKCLGERSSLIMAEKEGIPMGFTLLLFDDDTLIPLFSGLDYRYNDENCIYFNLLYKSIDIAINRGMKDIDLGITTLVPKKEMGGEVVTLNMYMKHFNPLLNRVVPRAFGMMTPADGTRAVRVFTQG